MELKFAKLETIGGSMETKTSTQIILSGGTEIWVLNPNELDVNNFNWQKAIIHRDGDLPAIINSNGDKFWYKNGVIYRDNDLPAIEWADGEKWWYKNGHLHRDNNLPSIIKYSGVKEWWIDGNFIKVG